MTEIEKFLNEQFTQVITEDKMGIKCLYKHKEGVIDDGDSLLLWMLICQMSYSFYTNTIIYLKRTTPT